MVPEGENAGGGALQLMLVGAWRGVHRLRSQVSERKGWGLLATLLRQGEAGSENLRPLLERLTPYCWPAIAVRVHGF